MSPDKKITISDIARESGFSESTVSLVINNSPKISEETRSRVLSTIEKNQYRPNIQARGLAMRASKALSVVVPDIPHVFADPYFGEIISGIYAHAVESGYKIIVDVATMKFIRTQEYLNMLATQHVDGLLFIGASKYDQYLSIFNDGRHAFVMVNNYFPDTQISYVCVDHRDSGKKAAAHLLGLGHRVIGSIHGTNIQTALDFQASFDETLRGAGIAQEDMPWSDGRYTEEKGFDAARILFAMNPKITAIMCGSVKMAAGAMRFLASKCKRVPQDVSVMACEDAPLPVTLSSTLTTIQHPVYIVGQMACKNLIALTRHELKQCQMMVPPELVIRESTAKPVN